MSGTGELVPGDGCALAPGVREVFRTEGPGEHFFGYYDKSPLDADGTRLLSHRVAFRTDRLVAAGDVAEIVVFDLADGHGEVVARTRAFNLQQGAMLQWLGPDFKSRILFNDFRDGRYVSVLLDLASGRERVLPAAVYSVAPDGKEAACVSYDRLFYCRPGYNYACGGSPDMSGLLPDRDGLSIMSLEDGTVTPLVSTRSVAGTRPRSGELHYLEHLLYSPSGRSLFFLHRFRMASGAIRTRVFVYERGNAVPRLVDEAWHLSHYAWRDETTLLLYGGSESLIERIKGNRILGQLVIRPLRPLARRLFRPDGFVEKLVGPYSFFLLDTATRQRSPLAGAGVRSDGHPSFNPLRPDIAVFDTYEDAADSRHLFLFHMGSGRRAEIGRFHSPRWSNEQAFRCDLHPRWDRQGSRVIIDSLHGGVRRSFVYDVSAVVRNLEDWVS